MFHVQCKYFLPKGHTLQWYESLCLFNEPAVLLGVILETSLDFNRIYFHESHWIPMKSWLFPFATALGKDPLCTYRVRNGVPFKNTINSKSKRFDKASAHLVQRIYGQSPILLFFWPNIGLLLVRHTLKDMWNCFKNHRIGQHCINTSQSSKSLFN